MTTKRQKLDFVIIGRVTYFNHHEPDILSQYPCSVDRELIMYLVLFACGLSKHVIK